MKVYLSKEFCVPRRLTYQNSAAEYTKILFLNIGSGKFVSSSTDGRDRRRKSGLKTRNEIFGQLLDRVGDRCLLEVDWGNNQRPSLNSSSVARFTVSRNRKKFFVPFNIRLEQELLNE